MNFKAGLKTVKFANFTQFALKISCILQNMNYIAFKTGGMYGDYELKHPY